MARLAVCLERLVRNKNRHNKVGSTGPESIGTSGSSQDWIVWVGAGGPHENELYRPGGYGKAGSSG